MDGLFKWVILLAAVPAALLLLKIFLPPLLHRVGSWRVRLALRSALPAPYYRQFNNISLDTGRGRVSLDHLVVSSYGLFMIEGCHLWGRINGSVDEPWWSRRFLWSDLTFRNPLHQARADVELLQDLLGLQSHQFHPLAVFTACSRFSPDSPVNVTRLGGMLPFIQVRTEQLLEFEDAERITQLLESRREKRRRPAVHGPLGSLRSRYEQVSGPVGALAGVILMAGLLYLGNSALENLAETAQQDPAGTAQESTDMEPLAASVAALPATGPFLAAGSTVAEGDK